MKGPFIQEIKENDWVEGIFLVKEKNSGIARNGNLYLNLKLMDKSGEINARIWDNAEAFSKLFERDDLIKIKGRVFLYQKILQLSILELEKYSGFELDLEDFLPQTKKDPEEMFLELKELAATIKNRDLKELLALFLKDEEFTRLFKISPAAKELHHAFRGGLLEHSLAVTKLVPEVVKHYQDIDRDLLMTGAILHDIGKIQELDYGGSFNYTDEGRLIGHITLGVEMIEKKMASLPSFPSQLAMLLKHLILSHHGEYNYGSPKRPKTLEALILYYLDDLDAKINILQGFLAREKDNKSSWTSYHKLLERYIYKKNLVLEKDKEEKGREEEK